MNTIEDAFSAIRREREYQDRLWGGTKHDGRHGIPEWVLYMRSYLREAEDIVTRIAAPKSDEGTLHIIRKIAAMAVACMEQNGIYERDMEDLDRSCELHGVDCKEE
jgi:hypothetical protein